MYRGGREVYRESEVLFSCVEIELRVERMAVEVVEMVEA
jgi:hypothetical protein